MPLTTPIPTEGCLFYVRSSGGTDIEVNCHRSIAGFDGQRNERDRTTLKDNAEEIALGIKRHGSLQLGVFHDEDDAGLTEIEAAYDDSLTRVFTWVFPSGKARQFTAYVMNFPFENGEVDQDYQASINLRITGDVTKLATFTPAP